MHSHCHGSQVSPDQQALNNFGQPEHAKNDLAPDRTPADAQANVSSEGADALATGEAFAGLWEYFQVGRQ